MRAIVLHTGGMVTIAPRRGLQDQITEEIRVMLARRRMTANQLARMLGWSASGLSRRLSGQVQITITDLEEIASALEIEAADLIPSRGNRFITRRERYLRPALAA